MVSLRSIVLLFSILLGASSSDFQTKLHAQPAAFHETTQWRLRPSLKYDVLCLLNSLTGDPYYLEYYKDEYNELKAQLTPEARQALDSLKSKIKDKNRGIISAYLCLYFSAVQDSTLKQMKYTVEHPELVKKNFAKTVYYNEDGWKLFDSVREDLVVIFSYLIDTNFEKYWHDTIESKCLAKIREIEKVLPQYNVIKLDEEVLGKPLSSNVITVNMLYYSQPHGIKVTGTEFLTDQSWPFKIVLRNAVHEMMHPPFDWKDKKLSKALNTLKADSFLMDKVLHHNPSFGYNSFEGLVEEDFVKALEQIVTEQLGDAVAADAKTRWKDSDGGMHVLAPVLYSLMKEQQYNSKRELFSSFLIRMIKEGKLQAGKIEQQYNRFYAK